MDVGSLEDTETLKNAMQRLQHLQTLHSNNLISKEDFDTRKSQIVDELTGTSASYVSKQKTLINRSSTFKSINNDTIIESNKENDENENKVNEINNNKNDDKNKENNKNTNAIIVLKHGPPNWTKIRSERAEKWIYVYEKQEWRTQEIRVKIDEIPFDKGGLRYVFHLQDLSSPNEKWVAKMSQDMRDNIKKEIYFNDCRMQAIAKYFCNGEKGYNTYNPPKKVDFLECYVLHLKQREGQPVCHVEKYIDGDYKKYNNNVGWINNDVERNTPSSFSHFTYEASKHTLLVCDIQGVNDLYTDPQVHSAQNQKAFGRGNLGQKGFESFVRTHRCNPICRYLKLPNINQLPVPNMGTLPANTHINQKQVGTVIFNDGNIPLMNGFPVLKEESTSDHYKKINDNGEDQKCCSCVIL